MLGFHEKILIMADRIISKSKGSKDISLYTLGIGVTLFRRDENLSRRQFANKYMFEGLTTDQIITIVLVLEEGAKRNYEISTSVIAKELNTSYEYVTGYLKFLEELTIENNV